MLCHLQTQLFSRTWGKQFRRADGHLGGETTWLGETLELVLTPADLLCAMYVGTTNFKNCLLVLCLNLKKQNKTVSWKTESLESPHGFVVGLGQQECMGELLL